jgi:hypothetical protein
MQVVYTFRLLDNLFSRPRMRTRCYSSSFMASYLENRVLQEPLGGKPLLNCMRQLAIDIREESIMTVAQVQSLEDICKKLCSVSMISSGGSMGRFEEIFDSRSKISKEEYDEHLLAAGLCTNTFSIVQRCITKNTALLPQLERFTGSSLFAPLVNLAVRYGDENLLEFLMISGTQTLHRRVRAMLFVAAAQAGRIEFVRFLYNFKKEEVPWEFGQRSSVHINEIDALYGAADTTHLETLKFIDGLREQYSTWPNSCVNLESKLADFAQAGDLNAVSYLLSRGVDAQGGRSMHPPWITNNPVKRACQSALWSMDVIDLLIKNGADPDVTIAAATSCGRTNLVRQLLDRGFAPGRALSAAAMGPYFDIVRMLLDAGVDVNEEIGPRSPLTSAISMEHTKLFNFLIERGADLNTPGTAEECVKRAKKDELDSMLSLLKEHGVDVEDLVEDEVVA